MKNVFFEVTKRTLKKSKARTAATIVGVAVLVATITCVMCVFSSLQAYLIDAAKDNSGNWIISVEKPSDKLKEDLKNHKIPFAEDFAVGYSYRMDSENPQRPFIYLSEMSPGMEEVSQVKIIKGRNVKNSNEIVIPETLENNGGIKYEVGQKIRLDIGTRINIKSGVEMDQSDIYKPMEEVFINIETREFTVVGISERIAIEPAQAPGYTAIVKSVPSCMDSNRLYIYDTDYERAWNTAAQYVSRENITINEELLLAQGVIRSDNSGFYSFAAFLIIVIELLGCVLLNNTFMIMFAERNKYYRILSAVGATGRQLKKIPFYESFIIGGAGVVAGMFSGILGAVFCIALFGEDIAGSVLVSVTEPVYFDVDPLMLLLAMVISIVSVLISAVIPAQKVGKIKPVADKKIVSVNQKTQKQWVKQKRISGKLFGIEGDLASRHFKNNSKQYRLTIISMGLCAFLLITTTGLTMYAKDSINMLLGTDEGYDIVYSSENVNDAAAAFISLNDAEGVEESAYIIATNMYAEQDDNNYMYNIMAIDDVTFGKFLNENDMWSPLFFDENKAYGLLVNGYYNQLYNSKATVQGYVGGVYQSIEIAGKAKKIPTDMYNYINKPTIVISLTSAANVFGEANRANMTAETMFRSSDLERTVSDMETMCKNSVHLKQENLSNVKESRETLGNLVAIVQLIMYIFTFMLSMISLMNVFNVISADMDNRRKEYATYNALGMTEKNLRKMIMYESMLLGGKTLAYAIPLSIIVILMVYRVIGSIFTTKLMIPYTSICVSIVWILALISVVTWYGIRQYKKEALYISLKRYNS